MEDKKVELFNLSKYTRKIPKYRYNGVYELKPNDSVVIPAEQVYFFKPYTSVGVVVRSIPSKDIKVEEKVDEKEEVQENVEVIEESLKESVVETTPTVEEDPEEVETVVYSEKELKEKNLNQLKDIAKELGIDATNIRKKDDVRKLILDFYEK